MLYPQAPGPRLRALLGDAVLVLALAALALLGLTVHDAIAGLEVLGRGVEGAGQEVQRRFDGAADAVDGTPIVGGEIAEGLRGAGEGTGGEVADLGRSGRERVARAADVLGWVVFAVPAALLLWRVLPARIALVRRLTAGRRALAAPDDLERRRLIAMRAAFSLPYPTLLAHTRDPLGDLVAGRYDALVEAEFAEIGLRQGPRRRVG